MSTVTRNEIRFDGCRTTPLASYLKAIGVHRVIAQQTDDEARGWWEGSVFHLDSHLDRAGLRHFLLHEYRPTPVLGPWNGGSGFYPKDAKGIGVLAVIANGLADRFEEVREAISFTHDLVRAKGYQVRPEKEEKARFVTEIRSTAKGGYLKWIDAAIALGTDELFFPPLLGSGGNDGRLDFTVNFLLNLSEVVDPGTGLPTGHSGPLLDAALFAMPTPGLSKNAIGQFSPGDAGGPNASSGFDGDPRMNPWDFILMIEGSILFATSAVRRLENSGRSNLAYPFTVRPTGAGAIGTVAGDAKSARAEIWLPVWDGPCKLAELEQVFQEGRLVIGERSARDGLDVARAVASLGIDRGIRALERYGFMQRSGNAYLATPLGRVEVGRRPHAALIDDLDAGGWLQRFRRLAGDKNAPARLTSLGRQLEDALFELAGTNDATRAALRALTTMGRCQRYLSSSPGSREVCGPVPVLGTGWIDEADDGSAEFAVAVALADLHGQGLGGASSTREKWPVLRSAEYMAPVRYMPIRKGGRWAWSETGTRRVVWSEGPLIQNTIAMTRRRLIDATALGLEELPLFSTARLPLSIPIGWIGNPKWDSRISTLVRGLALVVGRKSSKASGSPAGVAVPAAFALLKPYFTPASVLGDALAGHRSWVATDLQDVTPPQASRVVRLLAANRVKDAVTLAHRELRVRGMPVPPEVPSGILSGPRLLAALTLPLAPSHLRALVTRYFRSESDRATNSTPNKDGN